MECLSSSSSTGPSQNQLSVSSQAQEASSFQNHPPAGLRSVGITAFLADVTIESRPVRHCEEETISTALAPEFGPRGDAAKGKGQGPEKKI